jgi:tetratricopeptide (TPR) repeat protein
MKNWLFITVIAVFFALSSATSWSIENHAIINPAGSSTVPPSSIQSGLISNPNTIDTSSNLIITGNVRRGRHFRDTVPYGSTTTFRDNLGSSSLSSFSLSSFLRDSTGVEDFGRYAGKYSVQPYYSRSQTVTTTRSGYSGVFRPVTRINDRTLQGRYQAVMQGIGLEKQALSGKDTFASDLGLQGPQTQYSTSAEPRLIVQSIRELQLLNRSETSIPPQNQQLMAKQYQKQTQDPGAMTQDPLLKIQDPRLKTQELGLKTQDLGTSLEQRFVLWSPEHKQSQVAEIVQPTKPDFSADVLTPALTPSQADTVVKGLAFQDGATLQKVTGWEPQAGEGKPDEHGKSLQGQRNRLGSDVLEQIRRQLDDLTRSIDARLQTATEEARKDGSTKTDTVSYPQGTTIDWGKMVRLYETEKAPFSRAADSQKESGFEFPETPNWEISQAKSSPLDELNKLSQADLSARARRIRGPHTSPEFYSEAKFNQHLQTAQGHLKAGRYYAAADSFALASIYKLDPGEAGSDPVQAGGLALCLAGRGHALFAAGEYISSALFLSRALKIAPEYARTKIDLAGMLGGQNKLESRIAEIKEWLGRSDSAQLEFLLGYVCYRTGRLGQAKQSIDAAYTKMPQSPAVEAVKRAIDDAIAGQ